MEKCYLCALILYLDNRLNRKISYASSESSNDGTFRNNFQRDQTFLQPPHRLKLTSPFLNQEKPHLNRDAQDFLKPEF